MTTTNTASVFISTLTFAEALWVSFFRDFFSQPSLQVFSAQSNNTHGDERARIPNNFLFEESTQPHLRKFTINMSHTYDDGSDNALPALIIEDAAGSQQLGVVIDQRKLDTVTPERLIHRQDLSRFTYVMHCLSKDRGESRILASIVSAAITSLRDTLKNDGLNKIEPISIGPTQPLRAGSEADYHDTPVQVTFYIVEGWRTVEIPRSTAQELDLVFVQPEVDSYVRMAFTLANPSSSQWLGMAATIQWPSLQQFVGMHAVLEDPSTDSSFVGLHADLRDSASSSSYLRMSAKIRGA